MPRCSWMMTVLRGAVVLLILRVLAAILLQYPDYFPPNFESLFLQGRESTFHGSYAIAFYVHIVASPFVLVNGLLLLSDSFRRRRLTLHRRLGWLQSMVVLLLVVPSSVVMARQAFAGWPAGVSFIMLAVFTAVCTVVGVIRAKQHRVASHRRWMQRSYVLLASAVVLRLISGAMTLFDIADAETAYVIAAWCSWLLPLIVYEVVIRWTVSKRSDSATQ